ELGDRPDAQFFHHSTAVDLDRVHDRSEIMGYLLVKLPGNDVRQHLVFTWGEFRKLSIDGRQFSVLLSSLSIPFGRPRDCVQQLLVADRLGQKINRTGLHRPHAGRNIAKTGDKDNGTLNFSLQEGSLEFETVKIRHRDIEDGTSWY